MLLSRLLVDVTQEESLRIPRPASNSLNWILGHLLATRAGLIAELGGQPHWTKEQSLRYKPGPMVSAMGMDELRQALDESLKQIDISLQTFEPRLSESTEKLPVHPTPGNWGDRVGGYVCHEAYHVGQIGLVRRLIGKPGLF
jgi:uncharacterized damage-inducible protein DinB